MNRSWTQFFLVPTPDTCKSLMLMRYGLKENVSQSKWGKGGWWTVDCWNGTRNVVLLNQTNRLCFFFSPVRQTIKSHIVFKKEKSKIVIWCAKARHVTYYEERGTKNAGAEWPSSSHHLKICCWRKDGKQYYLKRSKKQMNFLSWGHYELKIQPCVTKPHKTYKLLNSRLISFLEVLRTV